MKILLVGCCGRMGKEIVDLAKFQGVEISAGVDKIKVNNQEFAIYNSIDNVKENFDAVMDFSTSTNHFEFAEFAKNKGVPFCLFATNITAEDRAQIEKLCDKIPIMICNNCSLGVGAVIEAVEMLAKRLNNVDIVIEEYHHKNKQDKPSGTAKQIKDIVLSHAKNCEVTSFRVGTECGEHKIKFFLNDEVVEISHRASSRKIFALGALDACKKIINKSHGLFKNIFDL